GSSDSPHSGRGLALHKDLAVSLPSFYPYNGIRPSSLGLGLPSPFGLGRHCSHLLPYGSQLLTGVFPPYQRKESGLSSLFVETEQSSELPIRI
ncbi:MAG TPA: hypothetical protein PKG74_01690, partial [Candidatus Colwellbacteria bacterium]|nr:hypothetical protein [Candidatus Colwellbacteria bacterium]